MTTDAARRTVAAAMMPGFIGFVMLAAVPPSTAADAPLWELGAGIAGLRLPHYRGSNQSHRWLLPLPYFVYRGEILRADRDGARALLFSSERVTLDLSTAVSAPTRSRDNEARRGMADLSPTFELGPNLNWTVARGGPGQQSWKLDLRLPVRAVVSLDSHLQLIGWAAAPNVNLDLTNLAGWNLGLQAGPLLGSRRLNAHFYDVAPGEATSSRAAYRSAGGYAGSQLTAAMSRRREQAWAGLFIRFDSLHGAQFADSPLVRQRHILSVGVAWSWVFAASTQRVSVAE